MEEKTFVEHEITGLSEEWGEVLHFFLAHWGQYACGIGVLPQIDPEYSSVFRRILARQGHDLFIYRVDEIMAADFYSWLEWTIPQIWGSGEDIGRIAIVFEVDSTVHFRKEGAHYQTLAKRFPFPILFQISTEQPWEKWMQEHAFLFSNDVDTFDLHTEKGCVVAF